MSIQRTVYYFYNAQGTLIFNYRDSDGYRVDQSYLFYSLREALQKFRRDYNLRHKHIELIKLY